MRSLLESLQQFFEKDKVHEYSSTQIQVPKELADKVLMFSANIPEENLYTEDRDYGRGTDIHVTVKYGLTTSNPEEVQNQMKQVVNDEPMDVPARIDVEFGEVSLFESDKPYDVVKIEIISEDLAKLNTILSELDNNDSHPEYRPHCTIAYVKKGLGKKYSGSSVFSGTKFEVSTFWFKGKTGINKEIDLGFI